MELNLDWKELFLTLYGFLKSNALGIMVAFLCVYAIGRVTIGLANKYVRKEEKQIAIRKWTRYITSIVVLVWILTLYYSYTHQQTPFFLFVIGILLAGIAFSLREVFANIVGWLVIVSAKGFRQGDRIEMGELAGDVIDIGILRTVVAEIGGWVGADQSTGRVVSVPNSTMLNNNVYNYTQGFEFIWDELKVLVTFESDWQIAEKIMLEAAEKDFEEKQDQIRERLKRARRRMLIRLNHITPKVWVTIADSGVELTLRYLVRPRRRRSISDAIGREILEKIATVPNVEFAYPTTRFYSSPGDPKK